MLLEQSIIIAYYAKRQQHTIKYTKNTKKTQAMSKLRVCSKAHSKECHINTDSKDIANALHTTGLTATLYEITSYLEPVATNVPSYPLLQCLLSSGLLGATENARPDIARLDNVRPCSKGGHRET